jgi:hypothetical protein
LELPTTRIRVRLLAVAFVSATVGPAAIACGGSRLSEERDTMKIRIATCLAACLSFGTTVLASGPAGATADAVVPAVGALRFPRPTGRDLPLIARILELDADQRVIVEAFIDVAAVEADGFAAGDTFYTDLSAVLDDAQRRSLPRLCDELRRDHLQSTSALDGENLEVGALAREVLGADRRDALEGEIAEYRTELDLLLARREPLLAAHRESTDVLRVRVAIRDLHANTLERIASGLSSDDAHLLREAALLKGYPVANGPVDAVDRLRSLCGELPERDLLELLAEADPRARAIRDRAVDAVRARDTAAIAQTDAARRMAADSIAQAEQAIDDFQRWIYPRIIEIATEANLVKSLTGRAILAHAQRLADTASHDWNDQQATLATYDRDGDGVLSDAESAAMMREFAKGVGKSTRVRL